MGALSSLVGARRASEQPPVRRAKDPDLHRATYKGMSGPAGGRWGAIPQPSGWYASSTQLCGIYPFGAGSFRPDIGTPLGRDIEVGTAVAGDMDTWFHQGLISSSSMMLFGLNGNGKSSLAQRFVYGMNSRGIVPAIFDPIKNEHGAMIDQLGGRVISVGPRSKDRINPLDLGALGEAADRIGGLLGDDLRRDALERALDLTELLVRITRGTPLRDIEQTALRLMTESVIARLEAPAFRDLVAAFDSPPPEVVAGVNRRDPDEFRRDFRDLQDAVVSVAHGELGHLVGGAESVRLELGNPGGFCFDTSSIPQAKTRLLSAAMLATWQIGFSTIDAHWELSQYDPDVPWNGYMAVQDEFWFPMRAVEGIVDLADRLGRTNRSVGVSELKITHTPKDFLSLPNPEDREKARGFAQRSGALGLMALSRDDLYELSEKVVPLNGREIDTVASFNQPQGWKGGLAPDGTPLPPPGAGKVLIKLPGRVGIPVKMTLTDTERQLHITDQRTHRRVAAAPVREV